MTPTTYKLYYDIKWTFKAGQCFKNYGDLIENKILKENIGFLTYLYSGSAVEDFKEVAGNVLSQFQGDFNINPETFTKWAYLVLEKEKLMRQLVSIIPKLENTCINIDISNITTFAGDSENNKRA